MKRSVLLSLLVLSLIVTIFLPLSVFAVDPDALQTFPVIPPVRETTFSPDDQAVWTLRVRDQAVPLNVVPAAGGTLVALAGGWLALGPDLGIRPNSFDWMSSSSALGSPWAQEAEGAVVYVTGSPGDLAVLYPETAVQLTTPFALTDLSQFAITDQGFLFVEGRRTQQATVWGADLREGQPLPFFAASVTAADDGTPWAVDSLQARPWRLEDGFWKPLALPQITLGRLTSLAPFPDSSGYFAAGPGWVGSFSSDGTPFWTRTTDLTGQTLPLDIKIAAGSERLYLWSAQSRQIWAWSWDPSGSRGKVPTPSLEHWDDAIRSEISRLENLGSIPEAEAVAQYGAELAASVLKSKPFDAVWTKAATEFEAKRLALRTRVIGAGVFSIQWSQPYDTPLATWIWQPDATWLGVKTWRVTMQPYWEGRTFEPREFKIPLTGDRAQWPGVDGFHLSTLQLPSWMNLEFRPDGSDTPVHWTRQPLPTPPKPYDLPVE